MGYGELREKIKYSKIEHSEEDFIDLVVSVSERLSLDPDVVLEWDLMKFLSICESFSRIDKKNSHDSIKTSNNINTFGGF